MMRPLPSRPDTFLAFLAAAILVAAFPAASATPDDEDPGWRNQGRSLDFSTDGAGFRFRSERHTLLGSDRIEGTFAASPPRLSYTFMDLESEAQHPLTLEVAWQALVEFRDLDGDGRFGPADQAVKRINLQGLESTLVSSPLVAGGYTATATYKLPSPEPEPGPLPLGDDLPAPQGLFQLEFTLVPEATVADGRHQDPTQVGLLAQVRDFPFEATDTALALEVKASTLEATGLEATVMGVRLRGDGLLVLLAWDPFAQGKEGDAAIGFLAVSGSPSSSLLLLAMPRSSEVTAVGALGMQRFPETLAPLVDSLPPGDWRLYVLGLALVSLVFGVPSVRRLRGG